MARSPSDLSDLSVLSGVAPELAAAFASLTGDIALVVDAAGVIRDVAFSETAAGQHAQDWIGRPWAETVTSSTRRKIELMLEESGAPGVTRRREVTHPSPAGADIPMSYAALRLGVAGPVIAVGRDLRAVAAIQQRFVEARQEMERDYWKLRQDASRQRMLAQIASDAVMVVDGATLAVCDINPAAESLFGGRTQPWPASLEELLATAARTGRAVEVRTRLAHAPGARQVDLSATPFRAAASDPDTPGSARLLLRARGAANDGTSRDGESVAMTDSAGRVVAANAAFRALCGQGGDAPEGRLLVDLLGDPRRHLAALLADVRREGLVHRSRLLLGGGRASTFECAVQAALATDGDQEGIGFTFVCAAPSQPDVLRDALLALLEQIGDVPLADLVRQAGDLTERHAVEIALRRAHDDRGSPAALLGVTDEDLAERLQRLGMAR